MNDVVFISFDERSAEDNWQRLTAKRPLARRIHGIKGILNAHKIAAMAVKSDWFFVVDGDNEVRADFNFELPDQPLDEDCVYVWRSQNPVNGLIYGYGGVKLFHKTTLLGVQDFTVDMATTISKKYVPVPTVASTTIFNSTLFLAWRGAFRECVKLAMPRDKTNHEEVRQERLKAWCHVGADERYGVWAIKGANEGLAYGTDNLGNTEAINRINDFEWLKERFWSRHYKEAKAYKGRFPKKEADTEKSPPA